MKKLLIILFAIFIASLFIACPTQVYVKLTITIEGTGSGTITIDGTTITSGTPIEVLKDDSAELIVTPAMGSNFDGWAGANASDVTGTANPYSIIMNADKVLTATFSINTAPTASNLTISGIVNINQTLTGVYDYFDADGDFEGATIFRWFSCDTEAGDYTEIVGEYNLSYTLQPDDANKYIKFEVTPIAQTGTTTGVTVRSNAVGPVTSFSYYTLEFTILPVEAALAGCKIICNPDTYPDFVENQIVTITVISPTGWTFNNWGGYDTWRLSKTGPNTYTITMNYSASLDAYFVRTVAGDTFAEPFEGAAGDWNALTSGNIWTLSEETQKTSKPVLQGTETHTGSQAVRFGNTLSTSSTAFTGYESSFAIGLENLTSEKALTFWYKKNTGSTNHLFIVRIDGVEMINIADDNTDWTQVQLPLLIGTHSISFHIINNAWFENTTDTNNVWVDDITLGTPAPNLGDVSYININIPHNVGGTTPVDIGEVSNDFDLRFAISNTGTGTLHISSVTLVGGASEITLESFPTTVAPNETEDIIFKTTQVGGPYTSGLVTINSDDVDIPAYQFAFICTALFFKEGFEEIDLPTGWIAETITGTINWIIDTSLYHSGTSSAKYDWGTEGYSARLYTPAINCSSLSTDATLSFWMRNPDCAGVCEELHIYYKLGVAGNWTLIQSYTTPNEDFTQKTLTLTDSAGALEYYIAFVGYNHFGWGVNIDDVEIIP